MAISDWPVTERPRERLLALGAGALSDAELLAVLLRTGIRGKSAVELARELLNQFGTLTKLLGEGPNLARIKGLGEAKRAQFAAAIELARRSTREEIKSGTALTSPGAVRDYLRLTIGRRAHEVFVCIWLDAQHRVIRFDDSAFNGTLTQTSVYPREIVKAALQCNAAAVIFAHNHPSGVAQPSQADELLTANLKEALALVEVKVLDHFIIAGNQAISFAERGLL
jgi:DNA repair protein RadC